MIIQQATHIHNITNTLPQSHHFLLYNSSNQPSNYQNAYFADFHSPQRRLRRPRHRRAPQPRVDDQNPLSRAHQLPLRVRRQEHTSDILHHRPKAHWPNNIQPHPHQRPRRRRLPRQRQTTRRRTHHLRQMACDSRHAERRSRHRRQLHDEEGSQIERGEDASRATRQASRSRKSLDSHH